ncbi:MAG: DUF3808 domain-containing protein [Balneolaceae bacterium]|nr:DUF3808 domain-containing protein [Balneolaceae bacterium]
MKNLVQNLLGVFLLAGMLAACSSSEPYIDQARAGIYTQNFDSAYAILNRQIEATPENGIPYFYKALANSEEAKTKTNASARTPLYIDLKENINTAEELFAVQEETPSEAGEIDNLLLNAWSREFNAGVSYVNNDSLRSTVTNPLEVAATHLKNATIVNPDSSNSYEVLGQILMMANSYENAIEPLQTVIELKSPPSVADYNNLVVSYVNTDADKKAEKLLLEALEVHPDSVILVQNLANVYGKSGNFEQAIELFDQLIERNPANTDYYLSKGVQTTQATIELTNEILDHYDQIYTNKNELSDASGDKAEEFETKIADSEKEIERLNEKVNTLVDAASDALTTVVERQPENVTAYNALGILHQSKGGTLFEKRNYIEDLEESDQYDKQAKELFREAMGYYEKVVEFEPNNISAWRSLSQVYVILGMNDKAKEAMEKAGQ